MTLTLDYSDVPVGALLTGSAARFGDRVAILYYGRELTFTQLHERACALANALGAAGIGRGDVVADPPAQLPPVRDRLLRDPAGGGHVLPHQPAPAAARSRRAAGRLQGGRGDHLGPGGSGVTAVRDRTAVRLVLVTHRAQALDPTRRPTLDEGQQDFEAFHADAATTDPAVVIDVRSDLAHLAYTGGTTGWSKGVQLPHRNVVVNSIQYAC